MAESDHSNTLGKSPAFQFYPKDFLTDENVRLMSMQERGIYITLMSCCWVESTLPADTKLLARLCGMPVKQFNRLWKAIAPCFEADPLHTDRIIHPRLDKERIKQILFKRRQSDNGKRGGRPIKPTEKPEIETQINPSLSQTGLAKKSSSSALCTLQSSDSSQPPRKEREVGRARDAGLLAGSKPIHHGDCLAHGPVCFRPRFSDKYLPRFGGNREAMLAWATGVCEAWSERVHNGENVPYGDDFAFWAAAYDEHFKPAVASAQKVSDESIAEHIRKRAEERGVPRAR